MKRLTIFGKRTSERLLGAYGPTALVTGASSGIGRATAVELAAAGFHLLLVARQTGPLDDLADELEAAHGIRPDVLGLDLTRAEDVHRLLSETATTDIGLYVAAAGFGTSGPFLDGQPATERDMLRLNCEAVLTTSHELARRMASRGRGGIILLSSLVGFQGMPNAAHYAATKAYVQALAEALNVELRPHHVDVLAAAPGPTHSGFAARAGMRMGRALTPDAVARGALAALGRRQTSLPGVLSKALRLAVLPLPRPARVRVMGAVMSGMTAHRQAEAQSRDAQGTAR